MKKTILGTITLLTIASVIFIKSAEAADVLIQANKQTYDEKTSTTTFDGDVKVGIDNIKVKSPKAFAKINEDGKIESAKFVNGAYAIKNDGDTQSELKSNIIQLTLLDKKIVAKGNAKSMVIVNKQPIVTIKASSQEFDVKANTIKAFGGVIINYKDIAANSSTALININADGKPEKVNLTGFAKVTQDKSIINGNNIIFNVATNEMIATGDVKSTTVLDDNTPVLITSNNQQYNKASNTMISSGDVRIIYKNYLATGPKAMVISDGASQKPNKIVFIGRSNIKEDARQIEADKIEITIDPKNFKAEGNVKTRFVQVQTPDTEAKKGKNNKKSSNKKVAVNSIDTDLSHDSSFDKNFQTGMKNETVPDVKDDTSVKFANFKKLSTDKTVLDATK